MQPPLTSAITDWRTRDESALPDIPPGEEYERVIAPQTFVVLHKILVTGLGLVRLQIGAEADVPFELESTDGEVRYYRPKDVDQEPTKSQLAKTGTAAASSNAVAIPPGMEVRLHLRNEGAAPTKPRAALLVQDEVTR